MKQLEYLHVQLLGGDIRRYSLRDRHTGDKLTKKVHEIIRDQNGFNIEEEEGTYTLIPYTAIIISKYKKKRNNHYYSRGGIG